MGNVTVTPFEGTKMLRIGTPKKTAESQQPGENTVYQEFTADSDTIKFSFRLFSWEFRGQDVLRFKLTKNNLPAGTVPIMESLVPPDASRQYNTLATVFSSPGMKEFNITGQRGLWLDTGWVVVTISGLTSGDTLTLSYTVGGTKDKGHGTWAYFDNGDLPPVAKFTFAPAEPLEGDIIQLADGPYGTDGQIVVELG
jgi:hypothetical protein